MYVSSTSNVHECVSVYLSLCAEHFLWTCNVCVGAAVFGLLGHQASATAQAAAALITISTAFASEQVKLMVSAHTQPTPTLANALQSPSVSLLAFCALWARRWVLWCCLLALSVLAQSVWRQHIIQSEESERRAAISSSLVTNLNMHICTCCKPTRLHLFTFVWKLVVDWFSKNSQQHN